jgi:large subunit ribosomal protein L31
MQGSGGKRGRGKAHTKEKQAVKKGIHPENYRPVVFKDVGADIAWVCKSTVKTDKTVQWEDGNEYPLYTLDLSSASHPFYTGKQMFVDSEGRVERFQRKYANKK